MTAVTIQSNKIVSNEVKDIEASLEPSYGKKTNEHFGQPNSSRQNLQKWQQSPPGTPATSGVVTFSQLDRGVLDE